MSFVDRSDHSRAGKFAKIVSLLLPIPSLRDEILNGKTLDRNSNYFARYCFENGIELYVGQRVLFAFVSCEKLERACVYALFLQETSRSDTG